MRELLREAGGQGLLSGEPSLPRLGLVGPVGFVGRAFFLVPSPSPSLQGGDVLLPLLGVVQLSGACVGHRAVQLLPGG